MAKYTIDLGQRFEAGFGFVAKNISPRLLQIGYNGKFIYGNVNTFVDDGYMFDELHLTGNGFNIKFGAMPFLGGNFGVLGGIFPDKKEKEAIFAPPPIISLSRSKRVTTTPINNSDVEVVENYAINPWDIKIQGILIDMETHNYPSDWVRTINKVFAVNAPFDTACDILADHDITSIYFTDIDSGGVPGFKDTWQFTLTAKSIKEVNFELKL